MLLEAASHKIRPTVCGLASSCSFSESQVDVISWILRTALRLLVPPAVPSQLLNIFHPQLVLPYPHPRGNTTSSLPTVGPVSRHANNAPEVQRYREFGTQSVAILQEAFGYGIPPYLDTGENHANCRSSLIKERRHAQYFFRQCALPNR